VAYRAEIEIGVKGVKKLDQFQSQLERLSNEVDRVNKKKFTVANLSSYNEALRKANETLSQTEIETNKAGKATGLYKKNLDSFVTALLASNDAQALNNSLVKQEIQDRGAATQALKAYNAAAASARTPGGSMTGRYLRPGSAVGGTEFSSPIGPQPGVQFGSTTQFGPIGGPSSSVLGGQSVPIAERLTQQLRDQERLQASLLGLENKSNTAAKERLRLSTELQESLTSITIAAKDSIKLRATEQGKINTQIIREGVLRDNINDSRAEQILLAQRAEKTEQRINAVLQRRRGLEEDARRRRRLSEDLALGAGFPLLFGGGTGSVLGGVAGAAAGGGKGGFGTQILFSAIGQQIDQLAESAKELGKALSPLTADLDAVLEAAGTLNSESGILARRLKEAGEEQLALSVATEDLSRIVGTDGVNALREFGSETSELNLAIKQLVLDVQVGIARLAKAATNFTGSVDERQVRQSVEQARGLIRSGEASPELVTAFNKRASSTDLSGAFGAITDNERDIVRLVEEQNKTRIDGLKAAAEQAEQIDGAAEAAKGTRANRASIASYKRQGEILRLGNDLLNERVVALKKEDIIAKSNVETLELQRELQRDGLSEAEKVQINTAITNRASQKTNELNQLDLEVRRAVTKESDKATKSTEKLGAAAARNRLAAKAVTASLEQQLNKVQLAGTEEGKRYAIQVQYENTLRRISALKDQDYAASQRDTADQIRTAALAKLELDQEQKRAKALREAVAPLKQIQDSQAANLAASREYNRLIMEGVLPAEAKRIVEYNKQAAALILQKDELIKIAEAKLLSLDIDSEQAKAQRQRIDDLKEERGLIEGKAAEGPGKGKSNKERIKDEVAAVKEELNKLLDPVNQVVGAAGAIGDAFSESFRGVIDGSMTAQQALANLFQRTADHFLDMTAQIIAAAIKMQAIQFISQIIGSMAGAAASPGSGSGAVNPGVVTQSGSSFNLPDNIIQLGGPTQGTSAFNAIPAAEGAYWPGGFKAFNQGGMVSQPTLGLVGEGGEPEYIIPQSKMRESMARYSRGSRGSGVIPSDGGSSASGDGGTAVAAPIDVRYTVERINSVDYVTADQFQSGMQSAAAQGAQRGEQNTLKRLQMSGSTRKRIGL